MVTCIRILFQLHKGQLIRQIILMFCICDVGHLRVVAYYSIGMVCLSMLLVCVDGPIQYSRSSSGSVKLFSLVGAVDSMGSIIFALGFAPAVLHTYSTADVPARAHFNSVSFLL